MTLVASVLDVTEWVMTRKVQNRKVVANMGWFVCYLRCARFVQTKNVVEGQCSNDSNIKTEKLCVGLPLVFSAGLLARHWRLRTSDLMLDVRMTLIGRKRTSLKVTVADTVFPMCGILIKRFRRRQVFSHACCVTRLW